MYEKHKMDVIHYENNAFVEASENLDDGDVEGPEIDI